MIGPPKVMSHEWGTVVQFPDAYANHHGRECAVCGFRQEYGKRFGSNRYPGFAAAPDVCDPTLNVGGRKWGRARVRHMGGGGAADAGARDGARWSRDEPAEDDKRVSACLKLAPASSWPWHSQVPIPSAERRT